MARIDYTSGFKHYADNGFWIGRGILPRSTIETGRRDFHHVFRQQLDYLGIANSGPDDEDGMHEDMKLLLDNNKQRYIASLKLCATLAQVHALFLNESIRTFTAGIGISFPVFQTAPVLHVISQKLRIPGGYYGYAAHQDWPALQSSLDTATIWIPFVSVDETNYTLDIIPKSHLSGLYPGTMGQNAFETDPSSYRDADFVPIRAEPGDVLFMSCFLLHRSSLIGGTRLRVACSMRYENASDPTFIKNAYPSAHRRVVERRFLMPDLPKLQQVRSIFKR